MRGRARWASSKARRKPPAALLKLVSGVWYDRVRRAKVFIVAGYGFAALSRPLIALVASWPMLLALRVFDRLGKGLRSSPRDALLARSVHAVAGAARPSACTVPSTMPAP